jgi:hypothetical protein
MLLECYVKSATHRYHPTRSGLRFRFAHYDVALLEVDL